VSRATIDFGIDLGTTSSCIACAAGTRVEIIRNNEGLETTPSAVWIDRKGRLHVGRRAKEQYEADEENACIEFKLQMGRDTEKVFPRSGQRLRPEDLSAEVLKSLLGDVRQRTGEEVREAVITVPADFDLPQCDATRKAALAAGLRASPLLQEPVAAALAYGFQSTSEKVYWLVYDLGGGTFDAAVTQMRDGLIRVVNHGGDRHLGGKLIDWAVVDQLLAPAAAREFGLDDFRRGNPAWRAAFARLKLAAEQAKIRLSRDAVTEIAVTLPASGGQALEFEYELRKADVEGLVEPFLLRTIHICKKVLAEKRLGPGGVEKVVLVGGPTLTPYLRERLADRATGLGIPLDTRLDPLTVVAVGAAIFAGTQRVEGSPDAAAAPGQYVVELDYQPVGTDPEPLVGGKVVPPAGQSLAGHTIEFVDEGATPPRRSGPLALAEDGTFVTNLWAARGRENTFLLAVHDAAGRPCPTQPDRLTITLGNAPTDPPLIHSLGVAMANNEMDVFIPKGTPLPARKRVVHRTARPLRRGRAEDSIRIPVVEGENTRRADRNRLIGAMEISAARLPRDVPANSEIEITIDIDPSRLLRTRAYIPAADAEFEEVIKFHRGEPDLGRLREEVGRECRRLDEARRKVQRLGDESARRGLRRIDEERIAEDLQAALAAATDDPDAADKCANRLLDLKAAIDDVEDAVEWPALRAEADRTFAELRDLVGQHGTPDEKKQADLLEAEAGELLQTRDAALLRRKSKEAFRLSSLILWRQPNFLLGILHELEQRRPLLSDPALADHLFAQAQRAVQENEPNVLRAALDQLIALLPPEQQQALGGYGGTTIR
jgi:molecular chaperone DnaK